jgi:hypothetical protein
MSGNFQRLIELRRFVCMCDNLNYSKPTLNSFFIDIILPVALWPWGRLSL